jgi:hypothetical protein
MEDANAGVKDKDRAYTHKEIQKMHGRANQKVRAIILLLASAGVRVGAIQWAIQSIYLKHIKKVQLIKLNFDDHTHTTRPTYYGHCQTNPSHHKGLRKPSQG